MADTTIYFDGNDFGGRNSLEDGVDAGTDDFEDQYIDDAVALDKEDDEFRLDSSNDLAIGEDEDEDDIDEFSSEYNNVKTGQKRKLAPGRRRRYGVSVSLLSNDDQVVESEALILEESCNTLQEQPTRAPGMFGRYDRKKGESLPAYHRKVTAKPDSPDQLMLEMREKGFSDRQIADKLAKDCHVKYDVKSISTRIMRIRLAQADNVDFLLKEGYKEWQFEDDQLLLQAHALADIEVNYEIERARAWRFRKVSEYMRRLNKDALFSATACRERYKAIMDGTARIPSEVDDDPEARRAEMDSHRIKREKARREEEAKNKKEVALEKERKDEASVRNAQKSEEAANKRAVKEAEKAQRAMQRAAKAQLRAQRALDVQRAQQERNTKAKKQAAKAAKAANNTKGATLSTKPTVACFSSDTPDPRSYLPLPDLRQLCTKRGIDVNKKTKKQLLRDIQDADDEWSLVDLKKMCRSKGLGITGTKAVLKHRLALFSAHGFNSFDSNIVATQGEFGSGDEVEEDEGLDIEDAGGMLLDTE